MRTIIWGDLKPAGERLYYSICAEDSDWLGVMIFTSASPPS
jgi:hypothetical protein